MRVPGPRFMLPAGPARLLIATALMTAACASAPPPRSQAFDPASPMAPEAPRLALSSLEAEPPVAERVSEPAPPTPPPTAPAAPTVNPAAHDHGSHARGKDAAVVYTCPMHPEVVSNRPGRCPKCGMKLEPRPAPAPKDEK
jgi:hypothetical protein